MCIVCITKLYIINNNGTFKYLRTILHTINYKKSQNSVNSNDIFDYYTFLVETHIYICTAKKAVLSGEFFTLKVFLKIVFHAQATNEM